MGQDGEPIREVWTRRMSFVLVDEAGQATEPETIVGLTRAGQGAHVVLIGDHQQLAPTVRTAANNLVRGLDSHHLRVGRYSLKVPADLQVIPTVAAAEATEELTDAWIGRHA